MAAAYKLEELPRTQRGYGFKARVPGKGSPTFRAPTKSDAKAKAMRWVDDVLSGRERTSPEITLSEYRAEIAPAAPGGSDRQSPPRFAPQLARSRPLVGEQALTRRRPGFSVDAGAVFAGP